LTHSTAAPEPRDSGLQGERTALAWTRTSLAFLANGALLTLKNFHGSDRLVGLIPAGLAAALALCTYVIGLQRQRTLRQRPLPTRITPRRQVYLVGTAALLLIIVTAVGQSFYEHMR
jgi:uncharacterized membrane protein YidH (DUF202 family)